MPAGPSLQRLIGYATITKSVLLTTNGLPKVLPEAFYTSHTNCIRDAARWRQYTGQRKVAKKGRYGAPAVVTELKDLGEREAKCITFREKIGFNPFIFMALQQPNSYEHDAANEEVKRQLEAFAQKFVNTRNAAITLAFANGCLNFDVEGNLLATARTTPGVATQSAGDTVTVAEAIDFSIPAINKGQGNGIISTSWASPSADIPLMLRRLKQRAVQATGYPLKTAFYGINVPSYFFNNPSVSAYLARHPDIRAGYLEGLAAGEIPNGLFGFDWVPVADAFFEDHNGVNQTIFSNPDQVTFAPMVNQNWYDVFQVNNLVPTSINIVADGMAAMNSMKSVYGMGGYGQVSLQSGVPTVEATFFDGFLPVIKNGLAIYQLDVAF